MAKMQTNLLGCTVKIKPMAVPSHERECEGTVVGAYVDANGDPYFLVRVRGKVELPLRAARAEWVQLAAPTVADPVPEPESYRDATEAFYRRFDEAPKVSFHRLMGSLVMTGLSNEPMMAEQCAYVRQTDGAHVLMLQVRDLEGSAHHVPVSQCAYHVPTPNDAWVQRGTIRLP